MARRLSCKRGGRESSGRWGTKNSGAVAAGGERLVSIAPFFIWMDNVFFGTGKKS